ncbi:protein phosphatase [Microbacterium resistens]|uniref:Protein phosphatase n=1 Tax=Microbacterium resistens TaxID=156977 RepID=A0ABU1SA64_9MICO|nr:protein phosphatase 2C domain-containing protein [Microbacterium resistens]MDR6866466.1 protein phosphatase [Microbacterium resistens]
MTQTSTPHTREIALASGDVIGIRWAGATDKGRRRENNQDAFLAEYPLFVVADGMGGHAGGEIASQRTIARLQEAVGAGEISASSIEQALVAAVADIGQHPDTTDEGTGTTLTGVYLQPDANEPRWVSLNIGDSRVYLLRDGTLSQITTDHSVVQELITAGRLSPEEAEGHPYSNVITRAVGVSEATPPDYREFAVRDGDRFVICSDGLTKELTDYGIQHFLTQQPEAAGAVDAMLAAALENGGRDNVTVIVIDVARRNSVSSTDGVAAE